MKSKRLSRRGTKFTCTNKASSTMPPRRGKKPATEPDLDALLLSLTGPGAGAPKKRSKRKQKSKKDLSPSPEPSLELRSVDGDVQQAVAKPKTRRKARQAVQVKDQTLATAIGKKRCAGRSKPKSKVALRRHDTQAALQDEDDEEKEYMGARSPSDCENDLPSFSSRDHDADDFIVVMKRMADERKKQRERDERRINAFFLSKMQKTQISAEQRVLAISAEASERTKAFVTDVSAQGKEILSAAKTIAKEDSKKYPAVVKVISIEAEQETEKFFQTQKEACGVIARETASRKQRLKSENSKIAGDLQKVMRKRQVDQKKLADALAILESYH